MFCWHSRALSRETRASSRPLKFCRRSRALSRKTQASSPARLWLSSARRSSVCAPLTEGEHTDPVASCLCRDDRGLDLVEVECAMPSSQSTSSRHCFMAPDEGVELGGWRSNSLVVDNAPKAALDRVSDVCEVVCYCAACTAAVPGTGRLGTCGMEEAASSSTRSPPKSRRGAQRFAHHHAEQENKQKPKA
jgi:hypothetical protein